MLNPSSAYPTSVYKDYNPSITWTGTLSTTVSGTPICSIAPTGAVAVYPSHPLLPEAVQTEGVDTVQDPRGWTFVAVGGEICGDPDDMIENLFPDLGVWKCHNPGFDCSKQVYAPIAPIDALRTALYLTQTFTSTEPDDGPAPTKAAPKGGGHVNPNAPVVEEPAKGLVPAVSNTPTPAPGSIVVKPSPSSAPLDKKPPAM